MRIIKLFRLFFVTVLFFFPSTFIFATSGTCSDHGGVDCSAMADWDGSAICKDGWRDSSENYTSAQLCKIGHYSCAENDANKIDTRWGLKAKSEKMTDIYNQMSPLVQQSLSTTNSTTLRELTLQVLALQSQYQIVQGQYWNAWNEATKECWALGDQEYYKQQLNLYSNFLNDSKTQQVQTQQPQGVVEPIIDPVEYCSLKLGQFGVVSGQSSCGCVTGYVLNENKTQCVAAPPVVEEKIIIDRPVTLIKRINQPKLEKANEENIKESTSSAPIIVSVPNTLAQEVIPSKQQSVSFWKKIASPIKSFWKKIFK